jgi:hypothetical protein
VVVAVVNKVLALLKQTVVLALLVMAAAAEF